MPYDIKLEGGEISYFIKEWSVDLMQVSYTRISGRWNFDCLEWMHFNSLLKQGLLSIIE